MTKLEKNKLIINGPKTIKLYYKHRQAIFRENGYFINGANYMSEASRRTFLEILKKKSIKTNWNEICEIFDEIQLKIKK